MGCCMASHGSFDVTNIQDAAASPLGTTNEHLEVIRQTLCDWAQPEYGDAGESWEKLLWQAALIAIATANAAMQIYAISKRFEIAEDYADLAEDEWNRFADNYAPFERALLYSAANEAIYNPDYVGAKQRAAEQNATIFQDTNQQLSDMAKVYSLCLDTTHLNDLNYTRQLLQTDMTNFGYRDEEDFAVYKHNSRWNRRSSLLNVGRNLLGLAARYAQHADNMWTAFGDSVGNSAQGAMSLLGYLNHARTTQYPALFSGASLLMGQAAQMGDFAFMGPDAVWSGIQ